MIIIRSKTRTPKPESTSNVYDKTLSVFRPLWKNIFLKPLIVLFFLLQIALFIVLVMVLPLVWYSDYRLNGWLALGWAIVMIYVAGIVGTFWFRVYDRSDLL